MALERLPMFRSPRAVFWTAFLVRLLATPLAHLRINPYSEADPPLFAHNAAHIVNGEFVPTDLLDPNHTWSALLSPLWLLPGVDTCYVPDPALVTFASPCMYARFVVALLGALSVYNLYVLVADLHSRRAATYAALPLLAYPSVVLVQSSMHREALVLFGMTTAARILIAPSPRLSTRGQVAGVLVSLGLATLVRPENLAIYLTAIGAGVLVREARARDRLLELGLAGVSAVVLGALAMRPLFRDGIAYLGRLRVLRAYGRTAYLPRAIPTSVPELVAFSWVAVAYFYFAPFPWMVEQPSDVIVLVEGMVNLLFAVAGLAGVRALARRNAPAAVGLLVGFLLASVVYGIATANVGTATRHRQQFVWILYLLGGIGFAEYVRLDVRRSTGARRRTPEERTG